MGIDKIQKNLSFVIDFDFKKRMSMDQLIGIWLTDLNGGFSLEVKGGTVKIIHCYLENVNQSIELHHLTWKRIISGELSMYHAIITGKVSFIGDQWEVINIFDHLKCLKQY
ncbi:hypothetical protein [Neobacillus vireti]|uniref:hypothetical protein n=1 Tax=Neobacillus vireti TaxID=220686 RepID=UPI0030007E8F